MENNKKPRCSYFQERRLRFARNHVMCLNGLTYEGSEGLLDDHHLYLSFLAAQQLDHLGEDAYVYAIQATFYPLHKISDKVALDAARCKMPILSLLGYDQAILRKAWRLTIYQKYVNDQLQQSNVGNEWYSKIYIKLHHVYLSKLSRCFRREAMVSAITDVLAEIGIDANNSVTSIAVDHSRFHYRIWKWLQKKSDFFKIEVLTNRGDWLAAAAFIALVLFILSIV